MLAHAFLQGIGISQWPSTPRTFHGKFVHRGLFCSQQCVYDRAAHLHVLHQNAAPPPTAFLQENPFAACSLQQLLPIFQNPNAPRADRTVSSAKRAWQYQGGFASQPQTLQKAHAHFCPTLCLPEFPVTCYPLHFSLRRARNSMHHEIRYREQSLPSFLRLQFLGWGECSSNNHLS